MKKNKNMDTPQESSEEEIIFCPVKVSSSYSSTHIFFISKCETDEYYQVYYFPMSYIRPKYKIYKLDLPENIE
jgi:hypothetical protein